LPPKNKAAGIRDRIKELRRVKASDLKDHPQNWRIHPDTQKAALRGVLNEVGFADAIVTYEDEAGDLVIIDGHLRADTLEDQDVPVIVTDLDADEAKLVLATFDPLSSLAVQDDALVRELLEGITTGDAAVQELLQQLADEAAEWNFDELGIDSIPENEEGIQARIIVRCNPEDSDEVKEAMGTALVKFPAVTID
jgi:ParB-like chromosome segregation protein Spo0J